MPFASLGKIGLHFAVDGEDDAPVVAFSNSLGTNLAMWRRQAAEMSSKHRVLRYDTRGHGRSAVLDEPTRISDLANDFIRLLDHLRIERVHYVGLSLGGMTGQALAAMHPDRLWSMSLLATSAYMGAAQSWLERAKLVRLEGMGSVADAVISRWFTRRFLDEGPPEIAELRAQLLATDPRGYAVCCGAIAEMDLRISNRSINTPTLVISGAEDPATPPAMGESISKAIANAEFHVLPGAAHLPAVERPSETTKLLVDFIDRADEAAPAPDGGGD